MLYVAQFRFKRARDRTNVCVVVIFKLIFNNLCLFLWCKTNQVFFLSIIIIKLVFCMYM